ncbi:hypothetical protein OS493_031032 [Desmophyllum pertusum]|uniref:Uncharacterized protein n=1 Tax=Desmophyllum pertusum TaxID=174260 RepID=A0A9W9Z8D4_9CNID|nr:hypothetical protein OS493_031032 [Desmophyllum pertusum]
MSILQSGRLAFSKQGGFDRFGKNRLFAPLMKWEAYKEEVETIKGHAESYEEAFNAIKVSIETTRWYKSCDTSNSTGCPGFKSSKKKKDCKRARRIAVSEKGIYTLVSCPFFSIILEIK